MGKCEQAEFTQGNLVLEILPIVNRFSELQDFFFAKTHQETEKNISKKEHGQGKRRVGVIQRMEKTDEAPVRMKVTVRENRFILSSCKRTHTSRE